MDGMLSQDEINALLNGMSADDSADNETSETPQESNESASDNTPNTDKPEALSDTEKDAVGEISNISMGTAATTLSSLLNQKVNITTPRVEVADWDKLSRKYDRPCVMLQIRYKEGIDGNNVLILKERDVKIITDLMMGGTGNVDDGEELTDLHLSAIGEAMNQMMGSAATSLSSMFNRKIDISPPIANIVETYNEMDETLPQFLNDNFVIVAFKMQIGDLIDSEIMQLYPIDFIIDSEIMQLYPIDFAKELLTMFSIDQEAQSDNSSASTEPTPAEQTAAPQPQAATAPQAATVPQQPMPDMSQQGMMQQGMPMQGMPYGYGMPMQGMPYGYGMPMQQAPVKDVNVSPASFQPFQADVNPLVQQENIDLIMDVPLEVTVELGRVSKSIKDILDFAPGTIVELNKIAGEAVDVLVNGKYVAKGEVVVIEENFGVRITEIIK